MGSYGGSRDGTQGRRDSGPLGRQSRFPPLLGTVIPLSVQGQDLVCVSSPAFVVFKILAVLMF